MLNEKRYELSIFIMSNGITGISKFNKLI